jgi:hypothetical protein
MTILNTRNEDGTINCGIKGCQSKLTCRADGTVKAALFPTNDGIMAVCAACAIDLENLNTRRVDIDNGKQFNVPRILVPLINEGDTTVEGWAHSTLDNEADADTASDNSLRIAIYEHDVNPRKQRWDDDENR